MAEEPPEKDLNDKEVVAKIVRFDLPFVVFTKDNLVDEVLEEWVKAMGEGREPPYSPYAPPPNSPGQFIVGSALPVFIPSKPPAPPYTVVLGKRVVGLYLLRRVNPHKKTVTVGEVLGDRAGKSSFSTVQCVFQPLLPDDPTDPNEFRFWEDLAVEAVNKFIEHYRVIADRPFVYTVTPAVIQEFNIGTDYGDGVERWVPTGRGSGHMKGFGGALAEELDRELRHAITRPEPPDFKRVLHAEVLNYADLQNWRMVAIETAVLFETFVSDLLRHVLEEQGKTPDGIEEVLRQKNGLPHNLEHLLKVVMTDVTGYEFKATAGFRDWKENVAALRHDLVHGRRRTVTAAEADTAFGTAIAAIKLLKREVLGKPDE